MTSPPLNIFIVSRKPNENGLLTVTRSNPNRNDKLPIITSYVTPDNVSEKKKEKNDIVVSIERHLFGIPNNSIRDFLGIPVLGYYYYDTRMLPNLYKIIKIEKNKNNKNENNIVKILLRKVKDFASLPNDKIVVITNLKEEEFKNELDKIVDLKQTLKPIPSSTSSSRSRIFPGKGGKKHTIKNKKRNRKTKKH